MPAVGIAQDGAEPPPSSAPRLTATGSRQRQPCQGAIDIEVRQRIGRNLRLLYADILAEPIPQRFETLIADLATRRETS